MGIPLSVGVNVSARNFDRGRLCEMVSAELRRWGVDPQYVQLEITESALQGNLADIKRQIFCLRELGVSLAIDDLGCGTANYMALAELRVHEVKVDRNLIHGIEQNGHLRLVAQGVVNTARSLGLTACAEGVECLETMAMVRQIGCDSVQGFFVSKALSARELVNWLGR